MHAGSERFATTFASRRLACGTRRLVELHAQLRRALEDVEELAERQKEQRCYNRDRMQNREKAVELTANPILRNGQRQPGHGDREQQNNGQKVEGEGLHSLGATIAESTPEGKANARKHQD